MLLAPILHHEKGLGLRGATTAPPVAARIPSVAALCVTLLETLLGRSKGHLSTVPSVSARELLAQGWWIWTATTAARGSRYPQ